MLYLLEGHTPKPIEDAREWARVISSLDRMVAVERGIGPQGIDVVTSFTGMARYGTAGKAGVPLLFQTMVFGGALDGATTHYATWEEAESGHAAVLARVLSFLR